LNILIIAAHPDDEVLGCGGTIARYTAEGASLSILILANGLTSRAGFDSSQEAELVRVHHDRARCAGKILGAKEVNFAGFPDQKLDTLPLLEITQNIEREIERVRPEFVFTHHGGDLNMDHVITFRATMTAVRPTAGKSIKALYAYEVPSSTEWAFKQFSPVFEPNVFMDIEESLGKKIQAMQIYESETREFPHPRSPEILRSAARRWGSHVGMAAAEAFVCVWEIR